MIDPIAALIIEVLVYSVIFTIMLGLHLHNRAEHKLRMKHDAEMEALRGKFDAEHDAFQGRPHIVAASYPTPYRDAYNQVGLAETLKMLQKEQAVTSRRLDQLERQLKSNAA